MGSRRVFSIFGVAAALGVATLSGPALGQVNLLDADPNSPTFNNPSFELPVVSGAIPVALSANKWTLTAPTQIVEVPGVGEVPVPAGAGVFPNPATVEGGRIGGADGAQLAYLYSNTLNDAITGLPVDHAFTQILPLTYQAGKQYQLAVGVAHAQAQPPPDAEFTLSLFAHDPSNPGVEQLLASDVVSNTGEINGLTLTDFFATTPQISGSAIGKQIGIRFKTHTAPQSSSGTGQFDFDNVRLTEVPEPAGVALWAGAGLAAIAARRRRNV